jgi:GH24 family phage-related lysozyme (muramidase)
MLKLINAGRVTDACHQLPLWVWAGPPQNRVKLPGLVNRRAAEMKLCLGGGI